MMPTNIQALVWAILAISIAANAWFLKRAATAVDNALERVGNLELWKAQVEERERIRELAQYPSPAMAANSRRA